MDWHRRSIRMGAAVIILAVLLRLYGTGAMAALLDPAVGTLMVYLETGRVAQAIQVPEDPPPETTIPAPTEPPLPHFSGDQAELIYIRGTGPETVDVPAMLETALTLDLTGEGPTVLILHTHTTESYTPDPGAEYDQTSAYRTLDPDHNMIAQGQHLAQLLEAQGIGVVQAQAVHDYPDYSGAYDRSRKTIQEILAQYPTIRLVLDLHRDAASDGNGGQFDSSAQVDGQESAQLMLVVSTAHSYWAENMNLAVKLTAQLETAHPGLTRGILTRASLYNQDLGVATLLVEVGAAGNTRQEALLAVEALAQALADLSQGAEGV